VAKKIDDEVEQKKVSKAHAYREAEAVLGKEAALDDVHKFILEKFAIDMPKGQISAYRSLEKSRGGAKPGKRGRKPKSETMLGATSSSNDAVIQFLSAVRGWENKIGAEKVVEVISALYKR